MPSHLVVDEHNNLTEQRETIHQPKGLRFFAHLVSYLFHPLFIPVYVILFLVKEQTYLFGGLDEWHKLTIILQVVVNCTFLPLVSVLLLRGLKFIDSLTLRTQRERIIPYAIVMIFYFWNWYVVKNNYLPQPVIRFFLAVFIASIAGFLANIYFKISMHTLAMGVLCMFTCFMAFSDEQNYTLYLSLVFLASGLVATSRLICSDHTPFEIYAGFAAGIISQVLAYWFS